MDQNPPTTTPKVTFGIHEHRCKFKTLFKPNQDPEYTHTYHECICGAVLSTDGEWELPR